MKNKLRYIGGYLPWLLLLLSFDLFIIIILWISDIRILKSLGFLLLMSTIVGFIIISAILITRQEKKKEYLKIFLNNPDDNNKMELLELCNLFEAEALLEVSKALNEKINETQKTLSILEEYENYVEKWAHEIKLPLSLLGLLLDNRGCEISSDVNFKLEYVRNQIQENINQILFYYRIKGDKKDFLFQEINIREVVDLVIREYKPLLDEKEFIVNIYGNNEICYTDYRSLEFIFSQIVGNSIRYSKNSPRLNITIGQEGNRVFCDFSDNGIGVKTCDLPQIFEKSFTGDSGATRKKSTGMGLYLVKKLADDLSIDIDVKSKWQEGFSIRLYI